MNAKPKRVRILTPEQKQAAAENLRLRRSVMPQEQKDRYKATALEWRKKNAERIAAVKADYRKNNPDIIAAYQEKWKAENREHTLQYGRRRYAENADKCRAETRSWYRRNVEKAKAAAKIHRSKKRHEIRSYYRNRHKTDLMFSLAHRVRNRTTGAFRRQGFRKTTKTAEMLGCSWDHLKAHIERQFKKGMNWENRHLWHIDHIVPLASARDAEELAKLAHFSNLQPLWDLENKCKSDKIVTCQPELTLCHL